MLAPILAIALQKAFLKDFQGVWVDSDGQWLSVGQEGICFVRDGFYYQAAPPQLNQSGSYFTQWVSTKKLGVNLNSSWNGLVAWKYGVDSLNPDQKGEALITLGQTTPNGRVKSFFAEFRKNGGSILRRQIMLIAGEKFNRCTP